MQVAEPSGGRKHGVPNCELPRPEALPDDAKLAGTKVSEGGVREPAGVHDRQQIPALPAV